MVFSVAVQGETNFKYYPRKDMKYVAIFIRNSLFQVTLLKSNLVIHKVMKFFIKSVPVEEIF